MSELTDMIAWSGSGATLSMFVVSTEPLPSLRMSAGGSAPIEIRVYRMERPDESESSAVIEYDAIFASVPDRFAEYVAGCLSEAVSAGALVAWFAFEGSFHFDDLLTPEVCSQVYGVGDRAGIALVTAADQLRVGGWAQRVAVAREHLPRTDRLNGARQ